MTSKSWARSKKVKSRPCSSSVLAELSGAMHASSFPGHIGHIPPPGRAVLEKDNYKLKEILQYSGHSLSFQSDDWM